MVTKELHMLTQLLVVAAQLQAFPIAAQPAPAPTNDPPTIRVWFNSDGDYAFGDRAKVYAKSTADGYLVVLRADLDGRVRVLFPVDPDGDQRIAGGKKYELKGRGGREAFVAEDTLGQGTVLAAYSRTPFRFTELESAGNWNSHALSARPQDVKGDPEAQLRSIVQRMQAGGERFDYDVATYVVKPLRYVRSPYPDPYFYGLGWPGWWGYGFGPRFGASWWYLPGYSADFRRWRPR
jgi:hypothetical protein